MAKATIINFTVEGSGEFPFDMLRYDSAWPTDTESALAMAPRYGVDDRDGLGRRRIKLACVNAFHTPTEARWRSFGWRVELLGEG